MFLVLVFMIIKYIGYVKRRNEFIRRHHSKSDERNDASGQRIVAHQPSREAPPLDVVGCDGNREEMVGCESGGGGEGQQDGETGEETAKSPPDSANVVDIVVQGYLAAQGPRPRSSPPPPAPSTSSLSSTSPTPSPRRTPPTLGSVSLRAAPVPVTLPLALPADASQPPPLPAPGDVAAADHGGTRPSL